MRPALRRLEVDAARHQSRVFLDEHVPEQQRARHGSTHAERIPVANDRNTIGLGRYRKIERIATRGFLAFGDLGAEYAIVVCVARKRSEYLLAVDDPAALDGFGLRAKCG